MNKVWQCSIYIKPDTELPNGFDWPPRKSVINTLENFGIEVESCASGWSESIIGGSFAKDRLQEFFDKIKHGDDEHQDWLRSEIESFFKVKIK